MQAGRTEGKGGRTEGDAGRVVMEVSRPEPFPGRASIQVASESGGAGGVGYRGRDRLPSFHFKFAVSETSRSPSHGFQVAARVLSASGAGFADRRISAALAGVALAGAAARLRRVFGRRPRSGGATVPRPDSARTKSERSASDRAASSESSPLSSERQERIPSGEGRGRERGAADSVGIIKRRGRAGVSHRCVSFHGSRWTWSSSGCFG